MHISIKRAFGVASIGLGLMVLGMLWSIVNTALASIQKELSATVLQLQWLMNCFGIFLCVPLLTMGKLGDAYGRKRLFLFGLGGTLAASILAGFAHHIGLLIVSMGLYGLSGSIILPLSQALLVHQFPESQKERAIGLWSIFASLSLAIGPLVGGLILNFWGWRWIYLFNIPIILLVLPMIFFFVEKEKEFHKPHCDWLGVGLLALVVGSLVMAIMQGPAWGWDSMIILTLFGLFLISFSLFVILERKTETPLFRPDLFSQRSFLFSAIPNGFVIGFIWVAFFLIPLYLQNMKGLSPFKTGLTLLLVTIPVAILSVPVSKVYKKWGAKPLMLCGLSFFIVSALLQSIFVSTGSYLPIALGCFALGLGWVLSWGPSISCALSSLPHNLAGIASGMFTTVQELGGITTLAIAGVFFRQTNQNLLAPQMDSIDRALSHFSSDQVQSLITNPIAVENKLGSSSPILLWLQEAFLKSYAAAFWYLLGLCIIAIILTLFLPKKNNTISE